MDWKDSRKPSWKPAEGECNVFYGTEEEVKRTRTSPHGPIHFAYVVPDPKCEGLF